VNRVTVLTPPGVGAIATIEIVGPTAWEVLRAKFVPARGSLPEVPPLHRTWFGTLGDEVVLAVKAPNRFELHTHGGRQVVQFVCNQLGEVGRKPTDERPWAILAQARTLRTASILLDQCHGAFETAFANPANHARLRSLIPVGLHLVTPWKVVIAGAPNVGKSSLVNAIAGYQRSIVSPIAGTTRDVVTTFVALDGWPVELADTAGLRRAEESLEAEGIALARRFLKEADLTVWLLDGSEASPIWPTVEIRDALLVVNKADQSLKCELPSELLRVSATTGHGIPELLAAIVKQLVPVVPEPGEGVPYTSQQAELVQNSIGCLKTSAGL
jgi:tRNA modification GTPase